jgi:hypothetical protein
MEQLIEIYLCYAFVSLQLGAAPFEAIYVFDQTMDLVEFLVPLPQSTSKPDSLFEVVLLVVIRRVVLQ